MKIPKQRIPSQARSSVLPQNNFLVIQVTRRDGLLPFPRTSATSVCLSVWTIAHRTMFQNEQNSCVSGVIRQLSVLDTRDLKKCWRILRARYSPQELNSTERILFKGKMVLRSWEHQWAQKRVCTALAPYQLKKIWRQNKSVGSTPKLRRFLRTRDPSNIHFHYQHHFTFTSCILGISVNGHI